MNIINTRSKYVSSLKFLLLEIFITIFLLIFAFKWYDPMGSMFASFLKVFIVIIFIVFAPVLLIGYFHLRKVARLKYFLKAICLSFIIYILFLSSSLILKEFYFLSFFVPFVVFNLIGLKSDNYW